MSQKNVIRKGDTTTHGGVVLEGIEDYPVMGVPIACKGHMVSCPKCKGTYPIVEGISYAPVQGKHPALEGMRTSCGAELIATQSVYTYEWVSGYSAKTTALVGSAGEGAAQFVDQSNQELEVTDLWFSYGEEETRLTDESRFYVDMNLHVETANYYPGEIVDLDIEYGDQTFSLLAPVDAEGKIKIAHFLEHRDYEIEDC